MERLRIAVIGLGWFGEIHCETIAGVPELELAALVTRRPRRLQEMSAKFGVGKTATDYREILADASIGAVSIVTQWHQHVEAACVALEAGKHVCIEKPMVVGLGECRRILDAARSARGILRVGTYLPFQCALPHDGETDHRGRPHRQDCRHEFREEHVPWRGHAKSSARSDLSPAMVFTMPTL